MENKETYILFIWIILFSLLFVVFFVPTHIPFSGEKDTQIVKFLATGNSKYVQDLQTNESSHMNDVRNLIMLGLTIFLSLTPYLIAKKKYNSKSLFKNLIWFDVICVLCLILFNTFFTLFHKLLFPQGNWQFSYDSALIQTYPQSFFIWMFFFIVLMVNLLVLIIKIKKIN